MTKDYSNDIRAQALAGTLRSWLVNNPGWYQTPDDTGWSQRIRTAEEVAADLAIILERMDVQLAGFLDSPDGQLIQAAVSWALPPQQATLFGLLVDAVLLAAQARNRHQKIGAGVLVALVVVIAFFYLLGD